MTEPPRQRDFLRLAIPNLLANLTVPLAGMVDLALLGHLHDIAPLAGVALSGIIFDYAYWTLAFLRMGTTGLTAKALGAGDWEASAAVFFRSFGLAMLLGLAMVLAQSWIAAFGFQMLKGAPAVEATGAQYFFARIWGAPATLGGYVIVGWLMGRHHPRSCLLFAGLLNGLNILFDWFFIFELGWGARGAGLATMIAEWGAFLLGLGLVWYHWRGHPRFQWSFFTHRASLGIFLRLQGHIMLRTFCLITTFSLFTNLSAGFGTVVLTGNTILLRLLGAAAIFIDGYAFALESLAGKYAGEGNEPGVRRSLVMGLAWNSATVAGIIALFLLWGRQIIGLLTSHGDVVGWAVGGLPFLCLTLFFSGFAYILDGLFIGLARGRLLSGSMLFSTVVAFLPFAWAAFELKLPALLWWGLIVFMLARTLTLARQAWRPLL